MIVVREPCLPDVCVLYLEDPLSAPVRGNVRHRVQALLRRGVRTVVLDMAQVSSLDAAGIGELVRAYNMAAAANALLRIAHAAAHVRQMLALVGLDDVLTVACECGDRIDRMLGARRRADACR
jgi:anti-anti-sigma factor